MPGLGLGFYRHTAGIDVDSDENYFTGKTSDTTIYHRLDSPDGPYTISFIGYNGATHSTANNNVTTDVAAEGLTAPVTVIFPEQVLTDDSLTYLHYGNNQIIGTIPTLPDTLQRLYCYTNQLSGTIPTLPAALIYLYCYNNQLSGTIPTLPNSLTYMRCYNNQLTGSIPALSSSLSYLNCATNQLTGYAGSSIPNTLGTVNCSANALTEAAADAILDQLVTAGRTSGDGTCVLDLSGGTNATPSAGGLADKVTLEGRGWTVTINSLPILYGLDFSTLENSMTFVTGGFL